MKYNIGDKVRVKSIDWYNQMLSMPNKKAWQDSLSEDYVGIWCGSHIFYKDMCAYCDRVMTIREIVNDSYYIDSYYIMEEDNCGYKFTDDMLSDSKVPKFKKDDRVETNDGLFGYIEDIKYDDVRNCYQYYVSFIVDGGYYYEEQLKFREMKVVDSKLPKFKVGDMICRVGGLSNGCLVMSVGDEYYGLQMGEGNGVGVLPVAEQDEWVLLSDGGNDEERDYCAEVEEIYKAENANGAKLIILETLYNLGLENARKEALEKGITEHIVCPDGYEFRDGDGNLIAVDKIVLAKKRVRYPKTYEECCQYLGCEDKIPLKIIGEFTRLINARNAYWEIAGEEMGLGKPWEPGDNKVFGIIRQHGKIQKYNDFVGGSTILEFPTEEMRDAFYDNFKESIEECKELL